MLFKPIYNACMDYERLKIAIYKWLCINNF